MLVRPASVSVLVERPGSGAYFSIGEDPGGIASKNPESEHYYYMENSLDGLVYRELKLAGAAVRG